MEIITFYNKFPNVKKKEEEKPGRNIFNMESKYEREVKPVLGKMRSKIKTEQPEYEE